MMEFLMRRDFGFLNVTDSNYWKQVTTIKRISSTYNFPLIFFYFILFYFIVITASILFRHFYTERYYAGIFTVSKISSR